MQHRTRVAWSAAVGIWAALAVSFASPPPAFADDALTIIAGSSGAGPYDALDLVAQGEGFYRAEHLNVERQYTGSAFTAAQLVATGKGDICAGTFESILVGYDKGLRLTGFLSRASRYTYAIGVLADSPIRTLADFKGANIGVPTLANGSLQAADSMLTGAGLTRADYAYVPIGYASQALDALVTKRVAGVAFPFGAILPFEIEGRRAMRVFRHPTLGNISNAAYFATPATIDGKSDVLARFARAIVEAAVFVRENPAVSARFFLEESNEKVTPDSLRDQTRFLVLASDDLLGADPLSDRIGTIAPRDMDLLVSFLADSGQIKARVPAADTMTNRFVAYANAFNHGAIVRLAKAAR
jgi:NitT/TauT family transport system substrate-binding protein